MADQPDIAIDPAMLEHPDHRPGNRPRVVIVGAGFAGLHAAKKLKRADCDVYIVDRNNHHLFQPLLYQVATAALDPSDIAMPIRGVVAKQDNARVIMASAERVDRQNKRLILDRGEIGYDYLIMATGAVTRYFGPPEWAENSTGLKTIEDAIELRRQILLAFEMAEQSADPAEIRRWLTFVVIGGGPTGVEMAGAIREIAVEVMKSDFRSINPKAARVVLIDAMPRILPNYTEDLSQAAEEALADRGVDVITGAPVESITDREVTVEGGQSFPTRTVIWAAGVKTAPVVETLGVEVDKMGRARVDADLTIPGSDYEFVVGDACHYGHVVDGPLAGLAPVAIQQGKHAARNIRRHLTGKPMEAFRYVDRGEMSTIGRKDAVADVRGWRFSGFFAWLAWLFVHLLFLVGFKNKVSVLFNWVYSYVVFRRGSRLIIGEPRKELPDEVEFPRALEADYRPRLPDHAAE